MSLEFISVPSNGIIIGQEEDVTVKRLPEAQGIEISFTSSDTGIATVAPDKMLTNAAGEATVKVKGIAGGEIMLTAAEGTESESVNIGVLTAEPAPVDIDSLYFSMSHYEWCSEWKDELKPITVIAIGPNGEPIENAKVQLNVVPTASGNDFDYTIQPSSGVQYTDQYGLALFYMQIDGVAESVMEIIAEHENTDGAIISSVDVMRRIIEIEDPSSRLSAPIIPAMSNGVVDDKDIELENGIRVNLQNGNILPAGSIIGFALNRGVIESVISQPAANFSVIIDESFLTNGLHKCAFYSLDENENASFSTQSRILVDRLNGGGSSEPLTEKSKILFLGKEVQYINKVMAIAGLETYLPEAVYGSGEKIQVDVSKSKCVYRGYDKKNKELFIQPVTLIETPGSNQPGPDRSILERIGEGYIGVWVSYFDIDTNAYYLSKEIKYQVDIIAPGEGRNNRVPGKKINVNGFKITPIID